nr:retrovirus-related Pol polyprotein from transposon TNT 1-94 [Tanacetum cinerariifolium]
MIVETILSVESIEVMIILPQDTIISFISEKEYYLSPISLRYIREPIWYPDSGCSRSMTGVKSYLHKYVKQAGPKNFSSPYTPEQNGVAESKNRPLIEAARTMLNGLVLSKHFWTKAVRIACYTQNKLIIFKRHDKTPYEISKERIPDISYFHVFGCPLFIHKHKDHLSKFYAKADDGYFLGYSFVLKAFRVLNKRRQKVEETYHVTFDESMEAIGFTNTLEDKIQIDDSSKYPPVIAPNEPDIPLTEDNEGPPDLINTEGTHEQNVQNDQIITQPTEGPSGNNTKILVSINESLVPDIPQSHISNQASISSHLVPRDKWSKYQHIKLVNIIGNPGEGMLTRSIAAKLTAASASECLFAEFLSEIEPKKNKKDEHGITTKNKARLVSQGYSQEEGIDYDETFSPVARMEAIGIFLAFATYMTFKVYQMDDKSAFLNGKLKEEVYVKQPLGFDNSEFPDYVCKLEKAFYRLKQAPRKCSSLKTPMVPPNNLGPDLTGKPFNETSYRGVIRSLMYLTATRPDIQFSTVLCARYQSNPKDSHLTAVKRIL